jgi:hypothetical protein
MLTLCLQKDLSLSNFLIKIVYMKSEVLYLYIYYIYIYIYIYGSIVLLLNLGRFFSFFNLHKVGRTPWTGDQLVERPLHTHRTIQIQN